MKIVGGQFKGRRLHAPPGMSTRPSPEKVREALFDILGDQVVGSSFVDLYAGTGAVGIEALSRGARSAIFVEKESRALSALRRNIETLGLSRRAGIYATSVEKAGSLFKAEVQPVDMVYCDPPYADKGWPFTLSSMAGFFYWSSDGLLVVEHHVKRRPECPVGFHHGRSYRYGDTGLAFFSVKAGVST